MLTAVDAHNLAKHFRFMVMEIDQEILAACNEGKYEIKITNDQLLKRIAACFNVFVQHYETFGYEIDFTMGHNTIKWEHVKLPKLEENPVK